MFSLTSSEHNALKPSAEGFPSPFIFLAAVFGDEGTSITLRFRCFNLLELEIFSLPRMVMGTINMPALLEDNYIASLKSLKLIITADNTSRASLRDEELTTNMSHTLQVCTNEIMHI